MLKYKQIWHGIKPIRWLNKFDLTQANMETENSGGEFNANNSSKLNTFSVMQLKLLVMSLAQESSNSIPQHLHSLNTNITQLDANFLSKLVENGQDIRKFEPVPSNTTSPLMSHVPNVENQTRECAPPIFNSDTLNSKPNPSPLPQQRKWTHFQR